MATIKTFLIDNKNLEFELIKEKLLNLQLTIKEKNNLFIINYNKKAKDNNINKELIKECRSIIFDKDNKIYFKIKKKLLKKYPPK